MLTFLFDYLQSIRPISAETRADLERYLEIIEVPKHQILLKEGQVSNYIYIVIKGLLRMYYVKDGEDICSRFMAEQHISLSVGSFYNQTPSYEFIETLEHSTLARISFDHLQKLYNDHIDYNYVGRVITQDYFIKSEERLFQLRKQSAEDRYIYFATQNATLLQRVPLKYIASYLGITLETMSRIRNKIRKGQLGVNR